MHHCCCPRGCYPLANPQMIVQSVLPAMLCCYSSIMMAAMSFVLAVSSLPMFFSPTATTLQYHYIIFGCHPIVCTFSCLTNQSCSPCPCHCIPNLTPLTNSHFHKFQQSNLPSFTLLGKIM